MDPAEQKINNIISNSESVVVIQADNPDGDSLSSALALEQILGDMGKKAYLYCGADIPSYLTYLNGWDRVRNELPANFDVSIIVDTSSQTLLEQLHKNGEINWLKTKPCIVIDHHTNVEPSIDFASELYIKEAVSAGEIIYELSAKLGWQRNQQANDLIMGSIMSDSLGLTTDGTSARSIHIVAELVDQGVSIPALEAARREMNKKSPDILTYKGKLLQRIEYASEQRIAYIHIPWDEIEKYSHSYNPSILAIDEMRMVEGVNIAIAFKTYPDGKITAKIRANYGYPIANELAATFGGGGHPYAAGFKVSSGKPFNEVKSECMMRTTELLDNLKSEQESQNENTQYAYTVD